MIIKKVSYVVSCDFCPASFNAGNPSMYMAASAAQAAGWQVRSIYDENENYQGEECACPACAPVMFKGEGE